MAHFPATSEGIGMRKLALIAIIVAGVAAVLKRQREREFDEAVWEEHLAG